MWLTYLILGGLFACAVFAITVTVLNRSNLWETIRNAIGNRTGVKKAVIKEIIEQSGGKTVKLDILNDDDEKDCEVEISASTVSGLYVQDVAYE